MEAVICRFIRKPPAALYDIGVGPKSEYNTLKRIYPKMEVFGCEPLVKHYGLIGKFPGTLWPVAIGEGMCAEIYYEQNQELTASMLTRTEQSESCTVPMWSLDELDAAAHHQKRILLWMDIEGMELEALKTGERLLESHRVRWINLEERIGENVPEGWCTSEQLTEYLDFYGYSRVREYNRHTAHMDVIYVSRHEGWRV
jgi:FkbM family methyltransferase